MTDPLHLSSRDNPLLQRLRRLAQDGAAYRRLGQVWLEGEHLCSALRARGGAAAQAVISEAAWQQPHLRALAGWAARVVVVPEPLFAGISALESPAQIGFVLDLPPPASVQAGLATVVLDRLQDPGNVGSVRCV